MLSTPKDVEKFFFGVFKEVMDSREEKNIKRNDFMQLCIQLKNKGKLEDVNDGLAKNGKSEGKLNIQYKIKKREKGTKQEIFHSF